jgi:hypothetical protein
VEGEAPERWSQGDMLLLDHLERRRASYGEAMWQAPALTVAGQAFLLQVLTNSKVNCWAQLAVLIAGLAAIAAAVASLLQLRRREVQYSERIGRLFAAMGSRDPRPTPFARWPVLYAWVVALGLFAVADVVAFFVVAI